MGCTYHPLRRENLGVHQKRSLKILQILNFGIEEVDKGQISTKLIFSVLALHHFL